MSSESDIKLIFVTKTHAYTISRYEDTIIIGSYEDKCIPSKVKIKIMGEIYRQTSKYLSSHYAKRMNHLSQLRMAYSVIKVKKHFECPICFDESSLYTPLPCFHIMCSKCVSKLINYSNRCPFCKTRMTDLHSLRNRYICDIPLTDIVLTMQTIGIMDPLIEYVAEC